MASEPQGGLTEYIQHHLHHNVVSLGDGAFMKIHLESLVVSFVLGVVLGCELASHREQAHRDEL